MKLSNFYILRVLFFAVFLVAFYKTYSQVDFIENKGQWNKKVQFMAHVGNGAFFLEQTGFTVVMHNSQDVERVTDRHHRSSNATNNNSTLNNVLHSHAYKVEFVNGNLSPEIIAENPISSVNNYFIGKDESTWAADCKIFKAVTYKNVYPNIDLKYYADAAGRMKYDLIVKPGGNPDQIALRYKGADKLEVINKQLIITTSVGSVKELYPYSYEVKNNQPKEVDCRYIVNGNLVKFKVNNYSPGNTLIIDPTQIFFSYSGSTADNWGFAATYGPDGSFYSGGISFSGINSFPVSPGAFQTTNGGFFDMAILKLSADGSNRVYATYIGGSSSDQPHSLIVDPQGNLIILGRTNSADYPTKPAFNIYGPGGRFDILVTKLNAAGNALIGSIKIGGSRDEGVNIVDDSQNGTNSLKRNYGEDARSDVQIDNNGTIYIASCTQSNDFKTSAGVLQNIWKGGVHNQDGVILSINSSCTNVLWSSFLGGTGDDAAYVLALGNNNNLYVAGGTASTDLAAISTSGVISSTNSGGPCDGFIIELTRDGTTALHGTYLGTFAADQVYEIQTDKTGNVYVMGTTEGNWPVINAAYANASSKQFISKLQPNLNAYIYSTVFGSGSAYPNISPTAFFVDQCENVYVAGWGGKVNSTTGYAAGTTLNMPVTPDAIKVNTDPSGSDFYFFVLKKNAASQLYGSFFGQQDPVAGGTPQTFGDHVDGGSSRFDKNGVLYLSMCGNCGKTVNYPGTIGSWSPLNKANSGSLCNAAMLKIAMNFSGVIAAPKASDTLGCISSSVIFSDTLHLGTNYIWDFGDGSAPINTTGFTVAHSYSAVGNYLVRLIAIDNSSCNMSDTAYLNVRIQAACPISLCPGGTINLTSNLTGTNYQWQLSTDSVIFNNINENTNYSGTNSMVLQLSNIPSAWYGYQYRPVVDGTNGNIFTIKISNTWTGTGNSAWENPANWSCGALPDANTDVIINSGTVVLNSNQSIRSLALNPGVNFTVNSGYNLTTTH